MKAIICSRCGFTKEDPEGYGFIKGWGTIDLCAVSGDLTPGLNHVCLEDICPECLNQFVELWLSSDEHKEPQKDIPWSQRGRNPFV